MATPAPLLRVVKYVLHVLIVLKGLLTGANHNNSFNSFNRQCHGSAMEGQLATHIKTGASPQSWRAPCPRGRTRPLVTGISTKEGDKGAPGGEGKTPL